MNRLVVLLSGITLALIAVAGCIDAARHDHGALAIIFGILAVGVAAMAIVDSRHQGVVLRRDLASWVERTSSVTGDSSDELTSRAVARLRTGFSPGDER